MADKKTTVFLFQVVITTLLIDAGLIFFFPMEVIIYVALFVIGMAVLAFFYVFNKKVFMLIVFLLFFFAIYMLWRLDLQAVMQMLSERMEAFK